LNIHYDESLSNFAFDFNVRCYNEAMDIALNPTAHRTGDVWHIALPVGLAGARLPMPEAGGGATVLYGYRCEGDTAGRGGSRFHPAQVLFDPRVMAGPSKCPNTSRKTPV
jgi:hypothetical protein